MKRLALALAAASLVIAAVACKPSGPGPAAGASGAPATAAGAPPYILTNDLKEVMGHAIDHTVDQIWLNQGWYIDASGETELFPTDQRGWDLAANAGLALAEISNTLLIPGRGNSDEQAWRDYANSLFRQSMKAHVAAEAKDKQAFFDAGGLIYEVCKDCHQRYILGDVNAPPAPQ
jgi:hypothetical protein